MDESNIQELDAIVTDGGERKYRRVAGRMAGDNLFNLR
jgi:hypothetical protein